MSDLNIPVLITLWDRPDYAEQLLMAISQAKPKRLYVFSDIVENVESDTYRKIMQSRDVVTRLATWDVEVLYRYNDKNEGPSWGIHNAISWAFEKEERLIILEHDYIPSIAFFPYCEEMLERYSDDERIWMVSGLNHFEGKYNLNEEDSYFFSKFASIAGFATWKRCWEQVDNDLSMWPQFKADNYTFSDFSKKQNRLIFNKLNAFSQRLEQKRYNTWDLQMLFTVLSNSGVGIIPSQNLISMVGVTGVNTSAPSVFHNLKAHNAYKVVKHPRFIQPNDLYDQFYINNGHFYSTTRYIKRGFNKIKRLLFR